MVSHKMSLKLKEGKEKDENKNWWLNSSVQHKAVKEKVECDLMLEKVAVVFDLQIYSGHC